MLHTKFEHMKQVVWKKKIFKYFYIYFDSLNQIPPGTGTFWTLTSFEQTW